MEDQKLEFRELLIQVQDSLSQPEVQDLVFLCTDLLQKDLSHVATATDLFRLLEDQSLLSSDDLSLIVELLKIIRRDKIILDLSLDSHSQPSGSRVSRYRCLLYEIAESLSEDDLKKLKFLLHDNLPRYKLQQNLTGLQLFLLLEKRGDLNAQNLNILEKVCIVRPRLKQKISQFKKESGADDPGPNPELQDLSLTSKAVQPESNAAGRTEYAEYCQDLMSSLTRPPRDLQELETPTPGSSFSGASVEGQLASMSLSESGQVQTHTVEFSSVGEERSLHAVIPSQSNPPKLKQYDMKGDWRGFCLIINNYDFSGCLNYSDRNGTFEDEKILVAVFQWLGFKTETKQDCSGEKMLKAVEDLSNRDHTEADCVVCCVLSHGFDGGVIGVDGRRVKLTELMEPMYGNHCKSLRQKPKLFFIQACQGNKKQPLHFLQSDGPVSSLEIFSEADDPRESLPGAADFLIALATVPHYVSYRSMTEGTWFIQSLCKKLIELVPSGTDLLSILTVVNDEVSKMTDKRGTKKQMPQPRFMLTKRVVFPIPESPPPI